MKLGKRSYWTGFFIIALLVFLPDILFADNTIGAKYRTFFGLDPRITVWFVAQLHLLFAAFVLGVPIFAVIVEYIGTKTKEAKYDNLAHESTALLSAAYATTAALGGLLSFVVFSLYPAVMGHIAGVMHGSFYIYAFCFFGETFMLYLYYYSWDKMKRDVVKNEKVKNILKTPCLVLGISVIPLLLYLFFFNGVGAFPKAHEVIPESFEISQFKGMVRQFEKKIEQLEETLDKTEDEKVERKITKDIETTEKDEEIMGNAYQKTKEEYILKEEIKQDENKKKELIIILKKYTEYFKKGEQGSYKILYKGKYENVHPIYIFFGFTLLLFLTVYGVYAWASGAKTVHIFLGILLNVFGLAVMLIANSWATYMMSPTGWAGELGSQTFIGSTWDAVSNKLWRPLNLHRLLGNIAFGGFIIGGYAAVKFLGARNDKERAHYDWMGYIGNFIGISGMILLPFAGYYLGREIYSHSPIMGNDMMGGFFSWTFVLQAVLIGVLFIGANYYLWTGMDRIEGAERYRSYIKYIIVILVLSFIVWVTPHNLPLTPSEQAVMGGQYHPVLKYLGLMPAKNAVIQFILLSTFFSFMLYRRANKGELKKFSENAGMGKLTTLIVLGITLLITGYWAFSVFNLEPKELGLEPGAAGVFQFHGSVILIHMLFMIMAVFLTFRDKGKIAQGILIGVTALIVTGVFGVTGFWVMEKANPFLRHLAVTQVLLVISTMLLTQTIDVYLFKGAKKVGEILWGKIGKRPQYALILLSVAIVMLMGLMGYVRSGLRQDWHVFGVMKDTSPQAMSPLIHEMTTTVGLITIVFFAMISFVFWLRSLGEKDTFIEDESYGDK